jgi:hypothetical protein
VGGFQRPTPSVANTAVSMTMVVTEQHSKRSIIKTEPPTLFSRTHYTAVSFHGQLGTPIIPQHHSYEGFDNLPFIHSNYQPSLSHERSAILLEIGHNTDSLLTPLFHLFPSFKAEYGNFRATQVRGSKRLTLRPVYSSANSRL